MAELVLGEMSEKMVEADGFGTEVTLGLTFIGNFLKLVTFNNCFAKDTDHTDAGKLPTYTWLASSTAGDKLPPPLTVRVAILLTTAGAAGEVVIMYGM